MFGGVSGVDEERRQSGVILVVLVGLWVLTIHDVSLDAIIIYASILLDIILIFIIEEYLDKVSYLYITTILIINFLIKFISLKLL